MSGPSVKKIEREQEKFAPDRVDMAPAAIKARGDVAKLPYRAQDKVDEQFPTQGLEAKSKKDKLMEAKLALSDGQGQSPFGQLTYSDADAKWLMEKQKAAEKGEFEIWFARNFDLMSPAQKKWARDHYPEFYQARQKLVKKQAKNLVKLANLKINGVRSYDDLMIQYLAETGRLDIGAVKHLLQPEEDTRNTSGRANLAAFKRGLLSPFRVFGEEAIDPVTGVQDEMSRYLSSSQYEQRKGTAENVFYGLDGGFGIPLAKKNNAQMEQWYNRLAGAQ